MSKFDAPTLCVQGIRDGVRRGAIESEFEAFGELVRVDIVPGNARRGVPDSRIAFVEFAKKDDARKAMRALNGRYVQGKCVMIQFARGLPGQNRAGMAPAVRRGTPEAIPQVAALAAKFPNQAGALAAKFQPSDRSPSRAQASRSRSSRRARGRKERSRSRDRGQSTDRMDKARDRSRDRGSRDRSCSRSRRLDQASFEESRRAPRRCSRSGGDRRQHKASPTPPPGPGRASRRDRSREASDKPARNAPQRVERSRSRWRPSASRSPPERCRQEVNDRGRSPPPRRSGAGRSRSRGSGRSAWAR